MHRGKSSSGENHALLKIFREDSAIKNSTKKEEPLQESNEMIKIYKINRAKGSKPVENLQ